jgi:hypothetical protein
MGRNRILLWKRANPSGTVISQGLQNSGDLLPFEGLNANDRSHLPTAFRILNCLAQLGRKRIEQLIGQGRIHPGLSLREAKALLAEYHLPESRRGTFRSKKARARFAGFARFVRKNMGSWTNQERDMVAEELARLARQIEASL